jgi:hypothetical protein
MKVESPLELSVLDHRPPSSTHGVHLIFPFPGKLQAFCMLVGHDTIIEIPMDGAKLKLAPVIPTVSHLLTPIDSRNLLLLLSLPNRIQHRQAKVRRRKDEQHVGTAARGIIE